MRSRIWKVCRGHLKWITDQMETTDGLIDSHYWATGRPIRATADSPLPKKSLMETPFHIIKTAEFCRIAKDENTRKEIGAKPEFKRIIKKWVEILDKENKHGVYAFSRPRKETPIHSFYFPDHAMIWWAARSVEYLGLGQELWVKKSVHIARHKPRSMSYFSDEIRANITKRFTTENPVLKKRMIAMSRSPIETRFLIREKEAIIFPAIDLGLFNKSLTPLQSNDSQKIDVWTNTVDCQAHHEYNQDSQWDHPLQFALAIIMSSTGTCINSKSTTEMLLYSKSILLNSSSPNGIFPGQLGEDKEPAIFKKDIMRDSYWHATFEVPYILWKYVEVLSTNDFVTSGSSDISDADVSTLATATQQAAYVTSAELNQALEKMFERLNGAFSVPGMSTVNGKIAMKKSVAFKNVDHTNIVELQDEWMYNEPTFFKFEYNFPKDNDLKKVVWDEHLSGAGKIIANVAAHIKQDTATSVEENQTMGYIINVPRHRSIKKYDTLPIDTNTDMYKHVGSKRTPEKAKKRLLHFCKADSTTALICYLASSERPEISSFFDRHAAYDKFFFEDITPGTNKWITEFHLSFYRIVDYGIQPKVSGIPPLEEIEYPNPHIGDKRQISRSVISFRFDGDYFDRYWTCHFFEFSSKQLPQSAWEKRKVNNQFSDISKVKANPWRQRRILELILVSNMMQEILCYSQGIVEEIKKSIQNSAQGSNVSQQAQAPALLDTLDLFTRVNNEKFVSTSRLWYKFQHILQIVENDIQENLVKIELWNDRERARGQDKPRWTQSDERDYRPIISKLKANNDHIYHELKRCHVNMTSFNASLSRNLDKMRGDLELRGADDIRLFTCDSHLCSCWLCHWHI